MLSFQVKKGLPRAGGPIGKGCCARHIGPRPSEWDSLPLSIWDFRPATYLAAMLKTVDALDPITAARLVELLARTTTLESVSLEPQHRVALKEVLEAAEASRARRSWRGFLL